MLMVDFPRRTSAFKSPQVSAVAGLDAMVGLSREESAGNRERGVGGHLPWNLETRFLPPRGDSCIWVGETVERLGFVHEGVMFEVEYRFSL